METNSMKSWYKKWWIIVLIVIGVLFVILLIVPTPEEPTDPSTPVEPTIEELENVPKIPPPEEVSKAEEEAKEKAAVHYEVVNEDFKGLVAIITVVTTDKEDEKIIRINDELLEKYKANYDIIFINYFDDSDIALTYFANVSKVSEAESDVLTSHYKAKFIYNTVSGYKELNIIKDGNEIKLKTY